MTVQQRILADVEQRVWQFRVQEFLVLAEKGSFADCARSELLDGEIWTLNAIHSLHAAAQSEVHGRLWSALSALDNGLRAYITPSVQIDEKSLPEPDIAVAEDHGDGFLPVAKVRLLVEISDTTLDLDLGRKQRVYAEGGVPEYWVVDVNARVIHQMWAPEHGKFSQQRLQNMDGAIEAATIDGLTIDSLTF